MRGRDYDTLSAMLVLGAISALGLAALIAWLVTHAH